MRVFISSVRSGLEIERDALPGLIRALGHTPVRFEDFSAQDTPSRSACISAVADSDVYLLLLGQHYGHRFPETNQSATHDEWQAALQAGLRIFAFQKSGVVFDEDQGEFARQVGAYGSGRFYREFSTVEQLQQAVVETIRQIESEPSSLNFEPLREPIEPQWTEVSERSGVRTPQLEIHVLPLDVAVVTDRVFQQISQRLPIVLRSESLVSQLRGLEFEQNEQFAECTPAQERQSGGWGSTRPASFEGIRMYRTGEVSVLFSLTSDGMGSILDRDIAVRDISRALRLVHRLEFTSSDRCAVATAITTSQMVNIGEASTRPRNTSYGRHSEAPVRVVPDESVPTSSLTEGADEIATLQVDALIRAFNV